MGDALIELAMEMEAAALPASADSRAAIVGYAAHRTSFTGRRKSLIA
jgi:hypothetical protein